jgi:hypothetical protein
VIGVVFVFAYVSNFKYVFFVGSEKCDDVGFGGVFAQDMLDNFVALSAVIDEEPHA